MFHSAIRSFTILLAAALLIVPFSADAQTCQCVNNDNGSGTITMPPSCVDGYIGTLQIVNGLPPATTIQIDVKLKDFAGVVEGPGGGLGGTFSTWVGASLEMQMSGTGGLAGFNRLITLPIAPGQFDWAPRTNNAPVQIFGGDVVRLDGQLFGDPDFDFLEFRSGSFWGLPGSGSSTLSRLGGIGDPFQVDSFFDIEYEIEFQGAPGSILEGFGGIHVDMSQISICGTPPVSTEDRSWGAVKALYTD